MGMLDGKKALIFGVANKHSIAWGIAQAFHEQGAEVGFSYGMDRLEKRVRPLAESIGSTFVEECDVTDDEAIDRVFNKVEAEWGTFDILVHAVAFAEQDDLRGRFVNTSRSGFALALDVSAYSLIALAQRAHPLMPEGSAIVTMTAMGSDIVLPGYNVMGVAKAALESTVRYLAWDLGQSKIRVNTISAGPIKTLAASGIPKFREYLRFQQEVSPTSRLITPQDVGKTAVWLCSDWADALTGTVIYVDAGSTIVAGGGFDRPVDDE